MNMTLLQHLGLLGVTFFVGAWLVPEDKRIYITQHKYLAVDEMILVFAICVNLLVPWN